MFTCIFLKLSKGNLELYQDRTLKLICLSVLLAFLPDSNDDFSSVYQLDYYSVTIII